MAPLQLVPPFQLVRGDPFNITLGGVLMAILAAAKQCPWLPRDLHWNLNTFTTWSLFFYLARVLLRQRQWDPFLVCNAMGVLCGYRTAMVHGLDENLRHKLRSLGCPLCTHRWQFFTADQLMHTLPAMMLLLKQVRSGRSVPRANSAAAVMFGTWFSFRQAGQLDSQEVYIPHPWRAAWLAIVAGAGATPPLVDALIQANHPAAAFYALVMALPWLVSRLNGGLKRHYDFEYKLQKARLAAGSGHDCQMAKAEKPRGPEKPRRALSMMNISSMRRALSLLSVN